MSYGRVTTPAICVFLAAAMVFLGCGNPAQEHVTNSYEHLKQWQLDEAIAEYTKAIELDPENIIAYTNRGFAYLIEREDDKAIADCNKAIELGPKDSGAYFVRGIAYYRKGEYNKATSDLEKVIQMATDPMLVEIAREALKTIGR